MPPPRPERKADRASIASTRVPPRADRSVVCAAQGDAAAVKATGRPRDAAGANVDEYAWRRKAARCSPAILAWEVAELSISIVRYADGCPKIGRTPDRQMRGTLPNSLVIPVLQALGSLDVTGSRWGHWIWPVVAKVWRRRLRRVRRQAHGGLRSHHRAHEHAQEAARKASTAARWARMSSPAARRVCQALLFPDLLSVDLVSHPRAHRRGPRSG